MMLVEAGIIGFLTFWIGNEYLYNAYFHDYIIGALVSHFTTYTAIIGLGIGLAGSLSAAMILNNLSKAKERLGATAAPRIRNTIDKILASIPSLDEPLSSNLAREIVESQAPSQPLSPLLKSLEKKDSEEKKD